MAYEIVKASLVRQLLADQLGLDEAQIGTDSGLVDLGVDELDMIELEMAIEDELGIEVPDCLPPLTDLMTFGMLVKTINDAVSA
jgi:acyl carrier protein